MKKTYMKPSMEMYRIAMALPIALSKQSVDAESTDVVLSNERKGIFSNDDAPSYNRNLW